MPRPLREQHPGAIQRLLSRGDHLEPAFCGETDRRLSMDSASYVTHLTNGNRPDELP